MKILLQSNRTVGEVMEEFNNAFPYLQIAFVGKKEDSPGGVVTGEVERGARLIEVSGILKEGDIDIRSTDTTREVAQRFEKEYGLPVRIYRRQKGAWLDTAVTDDLTLHEQNTWGREASKPLKIKLDGFSWNNLSASK